jgi:hypothetical protein
MVDYEIFDGDVVKLNGFDQRFVVINVDKITSHKNKYTIVTFDSNSVPHMLYVSHDCLSLVEEDSHAD